MTRRTRRLALGLSISLPLLLLGADRAAATEQRCDELGGACVCSEPLDTSSMPASGSYRNPADSVSKQCGWNGGALTDPDAWGIYDAFDLPAGIGKVAGVKPVTAGNGATLNGIAGTGDSTRRVCTRHYFRLSPDYVAKTQSSGGSCEANKAAEFGFGESNALLHWDFAEGWGWRLTIINFDSDNNGPDPSYNLPTSGNLQWSDCKNEWCRAEMCVSGNINAGSGFKAEAYIEGATSGKRIDWARTTIGRPCPGGKNCGKGRLTSSWISNGYRQGNCGGIRYITHGMQAEWDSDAGQFIGAAYEIEGGGPAGGGDDGGGSDPDPVTPPAPEAGRGANCLSPDPEWLVCEGFESGSLADWDDVSIGGILAVQGTPTPAAGSRLLAANIPAGSNAGTAWASTFFGEHPRGDTPDAANVDEVFLNARVRFSPNFAITYNKMFTMAAFDDWSATWPQPMGWSPYYILLQYNNGQAEGILHKKTTGGSQWRAMLQNVGTPVTFQPDRWYEMQYRMKLNTPGQSDGVFELWIDGVKKASYTDVNFRDSYQEHGWNHLLLSAYQNGGPAPADQSLYYDEVIVSPKVVVPMDEELGTPGQPQLVTPAP